MSIPAQVQAKTSAQVEDSTVLSTEPLNGDEARWTKLVKINYRNPLGQERTWESAERSTRPPNARIDGVGVIAMLRKSSGAEILLQKQFRPPAGKVCIEIPAGLLDEGESAEECAVRELKEETGYVGKAVRVDNGKGTELEGVMFNDPGFTNTNLVIVHVEIDTSLPENQSANLRPQLEDNEFITTFSVPLKSLWTECRRLEREGCAIDARVGTLAEGIELARRFNIS